MAKKAKGNRVQVILECTEMKDSGMPGTSRHTTILHFCAFKDYLYSITFSLLCHSLSLLFN